MLAGFPRSILMPLPLFAGSVQRTPTPFLVGAARPQLEGTLSSASLPGAHIPFAALDRGPYDGDAGRWAPFGRARCAPRLHGYLGSPSPAVMMHRRTSARGPWIDAVSSRAEKNSLSLRSHPGYRVPALPTSAAEVTRVCVSGGMQ